MKGNTGDVVVSAVASKQKRLQVEFPGLGAFCVDLASSPCNEPHEFCSRCSGFLPRSKNVHVLANNTQGELAKLQIVRRCACV